ncbi:hypothetical protein Tco_1215391 [Tanacetum coccineum]
MENEDDRVKKQQIIDAQARNIKGVPQKAEIAMMNLNSTINANCINASMFNKEDVPFALDNIQAPSTRVVLPYISDDIIGFNLCRVVIDQPIRMLKYHGVAKGLHVASPSGF